VLVALDYPRDEAVKAKVPNPKRNQELLAKYDVQGYPTILLMTPDGDVFGQTGYSRADPRSTSPT
jgi:thioredoxin-related protein